MRYESLDNLEQTTPLDIIFHTALCPKPVHGELVIFQLYQRLDSCFPPEALLPSKHMRNVIYLLLHLLTALAIQ